MAFCTVDDVRAKIQHITIDATSKPTETTVTDFCGQVSALTEIKLRSYGLTLPITDSTVLEALRNVVSESAAATVLRSIDMESEEAKDRQEIYDKFMKDIQKNPGHIDPTLSTAETSTIPGGVTVEKKVRYTRGKKSY
jgi:predicted component of type VI protein secretion system